MPEAAIGTPERVAQNVVTSENREEFVARKLELAPKEAPKVETPKVEAPKVEAPKPPVDATPEEHRLADELEAESRKPQPDQSKKEKLRERMSELANQRKDALAREAAANERAAKAERALADERASRAAPPPQTATEPKGAPQRVQFSTEEEYQAAQIDHRVEVKLAERSKADAEARAKQEQERSIRTYSERLTAVKAEVPDFDARIEAAKDLMIPPHIQEAMFDSEVGPKIALYFADHRDEHARIIAMRPAAALRELGKIEGMLETQKAAPAETKEAPKAVVEVSKAPPPIVPVKGTSGAVEAKVDSDGKFTGTYREYKALRKAGKL